MRALLDRLFHHAGHLAGLFMIGTLLAVLASILGRMHPAFDLPGADAYAGYCMATSAFLALAPTLRRGEHIRVTLVLHQLPAAGRRALDIACHLVAIGLSGALAWFSIRLVMQSHEFHDVSPSMDATPLWIPQLGMAAGTTLFALAFVADLLVLLRDPSPYPAAADGELSRIE